MCKELKKKNMNVENEWFNRMWIELINVEEWEEFRLGRCNIYFIRKKLCIIYVGGD